MDTTRVVGKFFFGFSGTVKNAPNTSEDKISGESIKTSKLSKGAAKENNRKSEVVQTPDSMYIKTQHTHRNCDNKALVTKTLSTSLVHGSIHPHADTQYKLNT